MRKKTKRYFIISYSFMFNELPTWCFMDMSWIQHSMSFPSKKVIEERIKLDERIKTVTILNIQELSESDFRDYFDLN